MSTLFFPLTDLLTIGGGRGETGIKPICPLFCKKNFLFSGINFAFRISSLFLAIDNMAMSYFEGKISENAMRLSLFSLLFSLTGKEVVDKTEFLPFCLLQEIFFVCTIRNVTALIHIVQY